MMLNEECGPGDCGSCGHCSYDDDVLKEECGIFAISGNENAAEMVYLGLYALQHRGQESTGIVTTDGNEFFYHKNMGLVGEVFSDQAIFRQLKGTRAIGHNRYSTTGSSRFINVQPLLAADREGPVSIGHNGNLTNTGVLYKKLVDNGALFQTTVDSEIIVHLAAMSKKETFIDRLIDALGQVEGAYCLVVLTKDKVIAARDPNGFRPLCLGKVGSSWVVASETCAIDIIDGEYVRDIEPGEIVVIDDNGLQSIKPFEKKPRRFCVFEYIYFSRPDSMIFGNNVDKTRRKLGKTLAQEHPVDADIVISVPDSSNTAALGYARGSGIPFEIGFIRNHYIGRTFINPSQVTREHSVRIKFNPIRGVLEGKKVIVIEDSIVRGTTFKKLTKILKKAGAKEIHLRVSSPPIKHPCFYGMDFPTKMELLANTKTVEEIADYLGVDSLCYLSLEGLLESVPGGENSYCHACFSGEYPTCLPEDLTKSCIENTASHSLFIDALSTRYKKK